MTVVAFHPERVSVWIGTPQGSAVREWYVEHIEAGHDEGIIVANRLTKDEALEGARDWSLPIFICR